MFFTSRKFNHIMKNSMNQKKKKKVSYQSIASRTENNWLSAFFVMISILAAPTSFLLISPPTEEDLLLTAFLSFLPGWVHSITSACHDMCNPVFRARVMSCMLHHGTCGTIYRSTWCLTSNPGRRTSSQVTHLH